MNILKMRYFIEVARCGSFSEAARRLYTAQPNLSKQIAQMESELGFSLFIRKHRSIELTPAGEYLYRQWKDVPDHLADDIEAARSLANRNEALCIGVLEGQDVNEVLHARLGVVSDLYPGLNVILERNSYQNLRSGLHSSHYDIIITLSFDVENEPDFSLHTLYEKTPAIAIDRHHPLSQKENLSLEDLKNEPFVVISEQESPGGYRRLIDSCAAYGFTPNIVRTPRSLESLLLCVEMGIGIAMLDQNTRLELSPYIVTIPQEAEPMAVVAVVEKEDRRPFLQDIVRILTTDTPEQRSKQP
jgi:DNA-binding transcriptional LysR family regulator